MTIFDALELLVHKKTFKSLETAFVFTIKLLDLNLLSTIRHFIFQVTVSSTYLVYFIEIQREFDTLPYFFAP